MKAMDLWRDHFPDPAVARSGDRPQRAAAPGRSGRVLSLLSVSVVAVALAAAAFWWSRDSADRLLQKAREAFAAGQSRQARELADRALDRDPASTAAALLAGRISLSLRQPEQALDYFERIPDDGSSESKAARAVSGELLLFGLRHLSRAEQQFRRLLAQDADDLEATERLAYILGLGSRSWEAIPYRLAIVQGGRFDRIGLFVLSMGELALENPADIRLYHEAVPDDPAALTGLARVAVNDQELDRAEQLLRHALAADPDFVEAQAKLGALLQERGVDGDFLTWHARLPVGADAHPAIWTVRGSWALDRKQFPIAVRCLWEAVRRDPNSQPANYRLGQALLAVDRPHDAQPFLARSDALQRHLYNCHMIHIAPEDDNLKELRDAAESAEPLGLLWEAYAWSRLALDRDETLEWARQVVRRLTPRLPELPQAARTIPEANPALRIDLSIFPLPEWSAPKRIEQEPGSIEPGEASVAFEDLASEAGINFTYFNGRVSGEDEPAKLYEQLGGGVAILDYDGDGWPDVYLTQGGDWPPDESNDDVDRLFRNLGNGTFRDVTVDAGLVENGFSQGVAAGDVDNDGFPDLYVANIGRNRLYRNNGDGTFTEVDDGLIGGEPRWSTSCAIADLSGDGLPDIYAVNYLSGDDLFTRVCKGPDGRPAPCTIQGFAAAQDQLFLNTGDGRFVEVTEEAGIVAADGRGLGIVAADFDETGRLSLFIANDVSPNFFFVNQAPPDDLRPRFVEQALPLGLAASGTGAYEACMGVAAGDANGDGQLDLYVTNFYRETSTLYVRDSGLLFRDGTLDANLAASSMNLLGFGTQFLDADLDGDLDLIVVNGHINDIRHQGVPYRMRPQYYRNDGRGRFEEMPGSAIGTFFEKPQLGRGLARVDWNRDGLQDAVISHLDSPAALLTNASRDAGHFITLHLRGVQSSRDAIGAIVTVDVGPPKDGAAAETQSSSRMSTKREIVRQLTAGDGFHASNQRVLTFGLGPHAHVNAIEVRWPAGTTQRFQRLAANAEYLLVEGAELPRRLVVE